jgi:hypothetical protein
LGGMLIILYVWLNLDYKLDSEATLSS